MGGGVGGGLTSLAPQFVFSMVTYYLLPSGATSTVLHGVLSRQYDGILDFNGDEWIIQVDISSGPSHVVDYLEIKTTNSKDSVWSYGPFVTIVHGVVYGFQVGHCGNQLDALGFYVQLADCDS